MKDCQSFNVFPNFVCFPLPNVNHQDVNAIRRRLLRSAINKRTKELRKLNHDLEKKTKELKNILNSIDWHILQKSLKRNVDKRINSQYQKQRKKLQKLTKNRALPFTHQEIVTNLSSHQFKPDELELLKNGLNYAIKPAHLNQTDILSSFENIHLTIKSKLKSQDDYTQVKNELLYMAQSYISSYRPTQSDLKNYRILQRIRSNKNIILLKPDKGNGVVILDRQVYKDSCMKIIQNVSKFKLLSCDPTVAREAKLQRFLRKLKKKQALDNKVYYNIYPKGSQPARFYGLPKLHKHREPHESPPLRPIISSVNTYNYNLAKHLCTLLEPLMPHDFTTKDSFSFVEELKSFQADNTFLISFDVESLFTNIPLDETISIAIQLIFENNPNFPIAKNDLRQLFLIATSQSHFLFDGQYYDQIDGVSMGSPLAPVLANLFMGHHERKWIDDYNGPKMLFYRRYVDDTFCVFQNKADALEFFKYLNSRHQNINFTYEEEQNGKISFLDILITKTSSNFTTSIFHKKTYTGLLTNFLSFTSFRYKIGLIKTLLDRTHKINNTETSLQNDIRTLVSTLKRNAFPQHIIDRVLKDHDNKQTTRNVSSEPESDKSNTRYFKLPFIGFFSKVTERKLQHLIKRFCAADFNMKLVFSSYKIKHMFGNKDFIPSDLNSFVVYKFSCAACNSCYIGETTRHLTTRIKEHTTTDKNSHIFKHFQNSPLCKSQYTPACFEIIDKANTTFSLKLKEALHIKKQKPDLNTQVQHFNTIFNL